MINATTAERLREYMDIHNLRQVDILTKCLPYCRKHGITITKSAINRYVSGDRKPTTENLIMLAEILNVNEKWLAGYDVPMERNFADALSEDLAIALADAAKDPALSDCLRKIRELSPSGKTKVYGYVDAVYDLETQEF